MECHICAKQPCPQVGFDKHLEYVHGNRSSLKHFFFLSEELQEKTPA
jgi:hypothetical protein